MFDDAYLKSTVNMIFTLRQLQEKAIQPHHSLYVDLLTSQRLLTPYINCLVKLVNPVKSVHDDMHATVSEREKSESSETSV